MTIKHEVEVGGVALRFSADRESVRKGTTGAAEITIRNQYGDEIEVPGVYHYQMQSVHRALGEFLSEWGQEWSKDVPNWRKEHERDPQTT